MCYESRSMSPIQYRALWFKITVLHEHLSWTLLVNVINARWLENVRGGSHSLEIRIGVRRRIWRWRWGGIRRVRNRISVRSPRWRWGSENWARPERFDIICISFKGWSSTNLKSSSLESVSELAGSSKSLERDTRGNELELSLKSHLFSFVLETRITYRSTKEGCEVSNRHLEVHHWDLQALRKTCSGEDTLDNYHYH